MEVESQFMKFVLGDDFRFGVKLVAPALLSNVLHNICTSCMQAHMP